MVKRLSNGSTKNTNKVPKMNKPIKKPKQDLKVVDLTREEPRDLQNQNGLAWKEARVAKPQIELAKNAEPGEWFSCVDYMKIINVGANHIGVDMPQGPGYEVTRAYIQQMNSSIHFNTELEVTRSEIAQKLQAAGDKAFTVVFHKKVTPEIVATKLEGYTNTEFEDDKKVKKLAADILTGELCTITGRLSKEGSKLGRSVVIDLNAPQNNNIRQVDHRTIECLVINKTKYVTKGQLRACRNMGKKFQQNEVFKIEEGDWYSQVFYLKYVRGGNQKTTTFIKGNEKFEISSNIVDSDYVSARQFAITQHVNRTQLLDVFRGVKDGVFVVVFQKQLSEKVVESKLKALRNQNLVNKKLLKGLAAPLIEGEEATIVGHLYDTENDMGRSTVVDLNAEKQPAFRQVDHRTIQSLVFEGVKYIVK